MKYSSDDLQIMMTVGVCMQKGVGEAESCVSTAKAVPVLKRSKYRHSQPNKSKTCKAVLYFTAGDAGSKIILFTSRYNF